MKDKIIRIEGVYDQRTFNLLLQTGIRHFSFDFRPKSNNFMPIHRLLELLDKETTGECTYYLHFNNEKDFVIQHICSELKQKFLGIFEKRFYLEFSCKRDREYCDSFGNPYLYEFDNNFEQLHTLIPSKLFSGLIINLRESGLISGNELQLAFWQQLMTTLSEREDKEFSPIKIILRRSWLDHDLDNSLSILGVGEKQIEIIHSLNIDSQVEVCYRNVDLTKLQQNIIQF